MSAWRMEEILEGLAHADPYMPLRRRQDQYLSTAFLDPSRMSNPTEIHESLRASIGQQLAQTIRARLLGSTYGRYYLVDGSTDCFKRWDGSDEDQLEWLVQSCREGGLIASDPALRSPQGPAGTVWACKLAEEIWPTDQGRLRLGLALQASGSNAQALHCFSHVARNAVVPSTRVLALLLATNLELHEKQFGPALQNARAAIRQAPESPGIAATSLLAGIQANDLPVIRESAYRLDDLGDRAKSTLDILTEQRARRVRDGFQAPPRRLPRSTRAYLGENALRVYHLNYLPHD